MPRTTGLIPIASPSGRPIAQASKNAPNTRAVDISTCSTNGVPVKPLFQISKNFLTIETGEGTNSGLTQPISVTSHQTAKKKAIDKAESQSVLPCPGTP